MRTPEEWKKVSKKLDISFEFACCGFFEADIVRTAPGYSAKEGSLISDSGPPLVGF